MPRLDEHSDQIRLSSELFQRLQGRFDLLGSSDDPAQRLPVDVAGTNERLILGSRRLDEFTTVSACDQRVLHWEDIRRQSSPIPPTDIVWLLLCGGMSFRTKGKVHPLMEIRLLDEDAPMTLLARQLSRMERSPFQCSKCYLVATPFNESALREHLATLPMAERRLVYSGGLAPKLEILQPRYGPPVVVRTSSGHIEYNPIGHFESLRWFVLSGLLFNCLDSKVVIIASYSNWGRLFDESTLEIAGAAYRLLTEDSDAGCLVEVMQTRISREIGSVLAAASQDSKNIHLIKPGYGRGEMKLSDSDNVLLSTNTWHFSVPALLRRLQRTATSSGDDLFALLEDASRKRRREQLAQLFDKTFPAEPQLIATHSDGSEPFLRIERDLDQLSLMQGPSFMSAVLVGNDRGLFLKTPADFENPSKLAYLGA